GGGRRRRAALFERFPSGTREKQPFAGSQRVGTPYGWRSETATARAAAASGRRPDAHTTFFGSGHRVSVRARSSGWVRLDGVVGNEPRRTSFRGAPPRRPGLSRGNVLRSRHAHGFRGGQDAPQPGRHVPRSTGEDLRRRSRNTYVHARERSQEHPPALG